MKRILLTLVVLMGLLLLPLLWLIKEAGDAARESIFRGCYEGLPTDVQVMSRYSERNGERRKLREAHVVLPMADGTRVSGWLLDRGRKAPLVVVYGGNNMQVGALLGWALRDTERSYLMINYRGYGSSGGRPTERLLVEDAVACLDWAKEKLGQPRSVALVGFSLGTGVATQVAVARRPDVLVLICPFDSIVNTACDIVPTLPYFFVRDRFNSAAYAPELRCRVVILAAAHDRVVRPERTAALRRALGPGHEYYRFPAGHGSIVRAPGFLKTLFGVLPER